MIFDKKANGFITAILILIIVVAIGFVVALYFDVDENDLKGYIYGKPNYDFNTQATIFIDVLTFNKMKFAYEKLDDSSKLCMYGIDKNNGDLLINEVSESTNGCSENSDFLGELYINKNYAVDVYDINCVLDEDQMDSLNINNNIITGIMCKDTWIGFYNNESIKMSYNYEVVK